MVLRIPLVVVNGQIRQLQAGDTVDAPAGPQGPAGPAGPQGPAGADGAGSKWHGWYLNIGESPPAGTGVAGDWFVNTRNGDIYGPKTAIWGSASGSIRGASGANGAKWLSWQSNGAPAAGVGADGDMFLDTTTGDVWGPKSSGAWPASASGNIKGPITLYVQTARPSQPGPWMWWVKDAQGAILDLVVNDGVA